MPDKDWAVPANLTICYIYFFLQIITLFASGYCAHFLGNCRIADFLVANVPAGSHCDIMIQNFQVKLHYDDHFKFSFFSQKIRMKLIIVLKTITTWFADSDTIQDPGAPRPETRQQRRQLPGCQCHVTVTRFPSLIMIGIFESVPGLPVALARH
jgi:hypothetical protein